MTHLTFLLILSFPFITFKFNVSLSSIAGNGNRKFKPCSNCTWESDCFGHGRVAARFAIGHKVDAAMLATTVRPANQDLKDVSIMKL